VSLNKGNWPFAANSALWKSVQTWRDDADSWLELAQPRLTETLRVNPLRSDRKWTENLLRALGGEPIPWLPEGGCGEGWQMPWARGKCEDNESKLLIRALHDSGRITRQEAVSMIPVKLLESRPGHHILDMCAAPGSKATQLCEAISDVGVVVANESNPGRANLLVSNSKRAGVTSMIVARHDGRHLPRCPNPGFDRILIDAPCSGSGTTRKNPELWEKWTERAGIGLQSLQIELVNKAAMLLAPGGRMIYSTCSLDPIENEAVVAEILRTCNFLILDETGISAYCPGLVTRPGMKEWNGMESRDGVAYADNIVEMLPKCKRIWNDENDSGGFFVAAFKHIGESEVAEALLNDSEMAEKPLREPPKPNRNEQIPASPELLQTISEDWGVAPEKMFFRGSKIYTIPNEIHDWFWLGERMLRRGRKLPGGHWHPFQIIQAGLPTWELRKGILQRPTSKGIHITAPKCGKHVHDIGQELLTTILTKGGPSIEEASLSIPTIENERLGGVVLRFTKEEFTWWLPAWLGGKLTLMIPDAERLLLSHAMGLEVVA
jgi:16S rRNA C967 or C1407 C5-methylase (RsmB/RsmF family)